MFYEISVAMTYSGGSVDFVPAAEDEAGLSVVHPKDWQKAEEERQRRVKRLVTAGRPKL